jgi:hypothetical protein
MMAKSAVTRNNLNKSQVYKKTRPIHVDPFVSPTLLVDKTIEKNDKTLYNQQLNLSMQLQETRQERSMLNYQKHAKVWDRYEQTVENYFER